jgi:hypothetical protein
MTSVPIEFLDEAIQYVKDDIIGSTDTDDRYFSSCKVRTFDQTMIKINDLSHIRKNGEENLVYVNSKLSKGSITYRFHCDSNQTTWTSWGGLLTSFTVRLNVGINPPYALKWESTKDSGRLKADERYDAQMYIDEEITAKDAISTATHELLHEYLPRDDEHYETEEIQPEKIKTLFEESTEKVAKL